MKRASYHTTLKELTFHGLLPPKHEKDIPRTNIHRWRNDSPERFVGSEINQIADKHNDLIKVLNEYPRMFYAYGRLVKTMITVAKKADNFGKILRESKETVVKAVERVKEFIPINKAVQIFGISASTYHIWKTDLHHSCESSFFKKCVRMYSNQITPMEIHAVKESLENETTAHWNIKSVHYNGLRKGNITVSINTMYMINRQLEIRQTYRKNRRRKKRKIGIRASASNEIWHADITQLKTLDGKRYYIYIVMDNFSRKVLSYAVRDFISGEVMVKNVETAFKRASEIWKTLNVKLIVDGGSENNNVHMDKFISQSEINIEKLVALRDIDYSNSMVEALNKTAKYQYLFPKHPENLEELLERLAFFVEDYNEVRPHGQLRGLTPSEAYIGTPNIDKRRIEILKQARIDRLAYNKANQCGICKEK